MLPKLQIALDNLSLTEAIQTLRNVANEIDVIEVGTILLYSEGKRAIEYIKGMYPEKIVVADTKIADAGKVIASMMFDAGADCVTVICCAELATIEGALELANSRGKDIQIELTGYWTFEQAIQWQQLGVRQLVYHRSRDTITSGANWGANDLEKLERLSQMGFSLTVAGGITVQHIKQFQNLPIHVFIAGRSIRDAADPKTEASKLKKEIMKYWS